MEPTSTPAAAEPVAAPLADAAPAASADAAAPAAAPEAAAASDSAAAPEGIAAVEQHHAAADCLLTVEDSTSPVALALAGIAVLGLIMKRMRKRKSA